jgi:predicted nucleotidyltransferase
LNVARPKNYEKTRGKDFIELKEGTFDIDLFLVLDGIETFEQAWNRRSEIDGLAACSIEDIIASKASANRQKDRESLQRLSEFQEYLRRKK